MGAAMLVGRQFQNGTLSRYPDAARELAVFAYASSVFALFHAMLGFLPQMVNALVRSRRDLGTCRRFLTGIGALLTLPVLLLAFTPPGKALLGALFDIHGAILDDVALYLRYLSPLLLLNTQRQFFRGLLIQSRRTGTVTVLNLAHIGIVLAVLILGWSLRWKAVATLALARVAASAVHLLLASLFYRLLYALPDPSPRPPLTYRKALAFFWPVAVTSVMFALSRPVIYAFVSRAPRAVVTVAALRVAFDVSILFHNPLNQFRHLFVTFGLSDLAGLRKFMASVLAVVSALMLVVAATPVGVFVLEDLIGVGDDILPLARQAIWVLCLVPFVVTVRNYFHGLALTRHRTRSMAAGGLARLGSIFLASWALWSLGALDHILGAAVLVLGFASETVVVLLAAPRPRAGAAPPVGAAEEEAE